MPRDPREVQIPEPLSRSYVLCVSSNKGGVGKTTITTNLAIYLRALREDLPILLVGLDDQRTLDRMFSLHPARPDEKNLLHAWTERSLSGVIQLGEYGIHYVPSPPDLADLKSRAQDPCILRDILERSEWRGIALIDTKSDLEALTRNAYHASDRILVPVSDWSSLEEAGKLMELLEADGVGAERARVLLSLVDRRARGSDGEAPLHETLSREIERRGWPLFATAISRSPRVEALNSGSATPLSILHHARGTAVHAEFRELAQEVMEEMGLAEPREAAEGPARRPAPPRGRGKPEPAHEPLRGVLAPLSWASDLLGALRGR